MADPQALCLTCGHPFEWHDRARATAKLRAEPPFERACYRDVRGVACPCDAFRDSGQSISAWRQRSPGQRLLQNALLTLLLVVMGLALLYAYRSQTPALPQVAVTQAVQEIQSGRVRSVVVSGPTAVLALKDGQREQTTVAEPDNVLANAITAYNAAHPSDQVELRYEPASQPLGVIGSVLLSLLPVLLIGGFFYYSIVQARRRS